MINKKKEGGFYASKVRLFLNEYDGIPLEEFCKAEKVSYNKMLILLFAYTNNFAAYTKLRPVNQQVKLQCMQCMQNPNNIFFP